MRAVSFKRRLFLAINAFFVFFSLFACAKAKDNAPSESAKIAGITAPESAAQQESEAAPKENEEVYIAPPEPSPVPEPIPESVTGIVADFYAAVREGRYDDISSMLTAPLILRYDRVFDMNGRAEATSATGEANYYNALSLGEHTITGAAKEDDHYIVTVSSRTPDLWRIYNDFNDEYPDMEYGEERDRAQSDYITQKLAGSDYPASYGELKITVTGGESPVIVLDENVTRGISEAMKTPFIDDTGVYDNEWTGKRAIPFAERKAYIESNITIEKSGNKLIITNNGDRDITALKLRYDLTDSEGNPLAVVYNACIWLTNYYRASNGKYYDLRPGYQLETNADYLTDEMPSSIARASSAVSVCDVYYEYNIPLGQTDSVAEFGVENIAVEGFTVKNSRSLMYYGNSITGVKVRNLSPDKTITKLSLIAEFYDADGVIRAEVSFNLLDDGESISPGKAYKLDDDYFFQAYGVPSSLKEANCLLRPLVVEFQG